MLMDMAKYLVSTLVVLWMLCFVSAEAQTFTDVRANLTGVAGSAAGWVDTDRDGDPDVFIAGEFFRGQGSGVATRIYTNHRNDRFSLIQSGIPDFHRGSFAVGDLDLDGINDLGIVGETAGGQRIASVLKGTPRGGFQKMSVSLTGVRDGSIEFADMDGDGDLDILISGEASSGPVTLIYRNDRNMKFTIVNHPVPGVKKGMASWNDFNLDGLPDIFISGMEAGGNLITQLYRNTGNGFVKHPTNFTGLKNAHHAFGDVDNDGDDDLLITGETAQGQPLTLLYVNNRSGFQARQTSIVNVSNGFADWGDMDLDGDLDLLISGMSANGPVSKVYANDRNFQFRDIRANIVPLYDSSGEWGDYDLDGDLDIVIAGISASHQPEARIYRNGIIEKPQAKASETGFSRLDLSSVNPTRQKPVWFYVYSSSFSDLYRTEKKDYYVFVSPVKKPAKAYEMEEKFQLLLIETYPTWPRVDQGNIVQNGFVSKAAAEKSRLEMIHNYKTKGFKLIELNW